MSAPSVAQPKGHPDFANPGNLLVEGDVEKVGNEFTPDFEKGGGQKTVRGPGEAPMPRAYPSEKQAQKTGDSYL